MYGLVSLRVEVVFGLFGRLGIVVGSREKIKWSLDFLLSLLGTCFLVGFIYSISISAFFSIFTRGSLFKFGLLVLITCTSSVLPSLFVNGVLYKVDLQSRRRLRSAFFTEVVLNTRGFFMIDD